MKPGLAGLWTSRRRRPLDRRRVRRRSRGGGENRSVCLPRTPSAAAPWNALPDPAAGCDAVVTPPSTPSWTTHLPPLGPLVQSHVLVSLFGGRGSGGKGGGSIGPLRGGHLLGPVGDSGRDRRHRAPVGDTEMKRRKQKPRNQLANQGEKGNPTTAR